LTTGIEIYLTYRLGSVSMALESSSYALKDLKWVGLRPTHLARIAASHQVVATDNELRRMDNILRRKLLVESPLLANVLAEVNSCQLLKITVELQAITESAPGSLLSTWASRQLALREWIH
jgi:DNA topoisomerase VI subunit A